MEHADPNKDSSEGNVGVGTASMGLLHHVLGRDMRRLPNHHYILKNKEDDKVIF